MRWQPMACIPVFILCELVAGAQTPARETHGTATNNIAATMRRFREIVAVQTVLDRHNLSGGRIDGVIGSRTASALSVWQSWNGLTPTGRLDPRTMRSVLDGASNVLTVRTVSSNDYAELSAIPSTWAEKSEMARLGYETILELLAELHHASENALVKLNPGVQWPDPPVGTDVVVPNPFPFDLPAVDSIDISLGGKWIRAYDAGGNIVAHFPCSIAADKAKRPAGELRITVAAAEPNYTFNPELFPEYPESRTLQGRKLIIPPGPNNPVGVAWVGLNLQGYGMHGTPRPGDIGNTESHGCFRLANWNAAKLLRMARAGMAVYVRE